MWKVLFILSISLSLVALQTTTNGTSEAPTNGTTTSNDSQSTTMTSENANGTTAPTNGTTTSNDSQSTTMTSENVTNSQTTLPSTTQNLNNNTTAQVSSTTTEESTNSDKSPETTTLPTKTREPSICETAKTTAQQPSKPTTVTSTTTKLTTKKPKVSPKPTKPTTTTESSSSDSNGDSDEDLDTTTQKSEVTTVGITHSNRTKKPSSTTTSSPRPITVESTTTELTTKKSKVSHKPTKPTTTTVASSSDSNSDSDEDLDTTTQKSELTSKGTTTTSEATHKRTTTSSCLNSSKSTTIRSKVSLKPTKPTTTTTTTESSSSDSNSDSSEEIVTTTQETKTKKPKPTKHVTHHHTTTPVPKKTPKPSPSFTDTPDVTWCNGKNEKIHKCPSTCPEKTCDDYLLKTQCKESKNNKNCKPECRCKLGYYRNSDGNCVSSSQCRRRPRPVGIDTKCDQRAYYNLTLAKYKYSALMLKEYYDGHLDNSIMVSGSSVLYLLAELSLSASGTTYIQLMNSLNWIDQEQIECIAQEFYSTLTAYREEVDFGLFVKIYSGNQCPLTDAFIEQTTEIFTTAPENVDFSNPQTAYDINTEVEYKSKGYITEYIRSEMLSSYSQSSLILMNAQSFKGTWEKQFNPKKTSEQRFKSSNGKIFKVLMMCQRNTFKYSESSILKAQIVEMRYDEIFSMAIFVPKTNIKDLLNKIQDSSAVLTALNGLVMSHVDICMPKFKMHVANSLKTALQMSGITAIFSNKTSGLKNIASCNTPYVSEIFQKLIIDVDELGPTSQIIDEFPNSEEVNSQLQDQKMIKVKANKPFLFYLLYGKKPIFAGVYTCI